MSDARTEVWVGESRYVFRVPLRLVHWTVFFAVIVLSLTGYWIGSGNLPAGPGGEFQMGWVRYIHTIAGWTFLAALLLRLYLFFFGNEFARWRQFVPYRRQDWREIKGLLAYYLFLRPDYPHAGFHHNRLAALTYLIVYAFLGFMVISGLALHGMAFSIGWQAWLTWPLAFFSAPTLRLMHHMGMWLIWGFVAHHLASIIVVDHETRGGLIGGMFSGFKVASKHVKH